MLKLLRSQKHLLYGVAHDEKQKGGKKMRKVDTGKIKLSDIKFIENSRLREIDDVADLMHDIENRGLLQAIGIRKNDNALIFGNRRVQACVKLGYDEIECVFYEDVSDEELLIANLAENIKRKSIGSVEIGRICKILLDKKLTRLEISEKLGISVARVSAVISSYEVTVGTPFEKLVIFAKGKRGIGGISETLIWKIQTSIGQKARRLSKEDWELLLKEVEKGNLTVELVAELRKILLIDKRITIKDALVLLGKCRIIHVFFHLNEQKLVECMKEEKVYNETEFIKRIVRKYNKDLVF